MKIWDENKFCHPISDFKRENLEYKAFLQEFEGENWTVADLRKDRNGNGFAWGKFGPNQFTKRHPNELLWVIQNKKKGFIAKLFGK